MTRTGAKPWCMGSVCMLVLMAVFGAVSGGSARTQHNQEPQDRFRDGTPSFLRLDSVADREAFRSWFTAIAEYQALRAPQELPAEINDCAALLRYAYRGALHVHTADWLAENKLEALAYLPSVKKYAYPRTPLGASLFRVRPPLAAEDPKTAFAEFADAKTLWQLNTYFVSRDV